jgi:very-short-patch-repair endonuclease
MSQDSQDQNRIAKQRIQQVFHYLKALNEHRNPSIRQVREQPWSMWLDDLPSHPDVEFPQRTLRASTEVDQSRPEFVLRVRRPRLTTAPQPPDEIKAWLRPGWDDPHNVVQHLSSRNQQDADGTTITIQFNDDTARIAARERWCQQREAWKEAELPARATMAIFDKLYSLHGRMEREAERYDLVVGDGILSWQQSDGSIFHPVLLQRVQLVFDAQVPAFSVVDADFAGELDTGLFQSVSEADPRVLRARREEFETGGYHPLDQEASGLLEGLVNQLSAHGHFVGKRRPEAASQAPMIGRAPVLFLRTRTKGIGTAIERVLDSLGQRDDFCDALRNIVGCDGMARERDSDDEPQAERSELPTRDVLFGKPANAEQLRIARSVDRHGSVLVQGPPGTGKSHTIANLIGHLLAHGQSVLVTSHTTKALRVLRDHLVAELRPLCVSVLESDLESRRQLEESVQSISSRLSVSDVNELRREVGWLEGERAKLIAQIEFHQDRLKTALADEYRDIVFCGTAVSPSQAARTVAAGATKHDWLPGPVALGEPCPLTADEVCDLYATNAKTTLEDDRRVEFPLPDIDQLPAPEDISRAFATSAQIEEIGQLDRRYWPHGIPLTTSAQQLDSLIADLRAAVDEFTTFDNLRLAAVEAGWTADTDNGPWMRLLSRIDTTIAQVRETQAEVLIHRPVVSSQTAFASQLDLAQQIDQYLSRGGRLSWWSLFIRPHWKRILSEWKIQDRPPSKAEDIRAIRGCLAIELSRRELQLLWDAVVAIHGCPTFSELGPQPEGATGQFVPVIRDALSWWKTVWIPLEQRIRDVGFDWDCCIGVQRPHLYQFGNLYRVINTARDEVLGDLAKARSHLEALRVKRQMADLATHLAGCHRPEGGALRRAIQNADSASYAEAYHACLAAAQRREYALRRHELLSKLRKRNADGIPIAEAWAAAIWQRDAHHGEPAVPGDVMRAWEWRQLNDELIRRDEVDLEQIGRDLENLNSRIKDVTNQLVDRRAWAGQVRRTTLAHRQALMGWLQTINRIGKGFGKRVAALRTAAQQEMEKCRDAVPVWVMPLSRVVENFDFSAPRFDVVIIDEASQCDVMALLALAIARNVVVVGDDKQVSPVAVGQKLDIVGNLIRLHLDGVPNAVLYDGRMSVYDLAKASFPGLICLQEHFRCVPDIIQFSNHLCYAPSTPLKPMREPSSSPLMPHVVPYRVEGGARGSGKTNLEEARVVASLVIAACEHSAYANMTFGVISLLGDDQAIEIERLLLIHLSPDEYARRRIICGNSAQFQGDERGVIFLSMVQSPGDGPQSMLDRPESRQRYNVAASRARDQMWVVYSLNHEVDLKPGDLRRRLIEHAMDPAALGRALDEAESKTESEFERQVCAHLVARGYRVRPQWPVGHYRIDLVVEGVDRRRVAIECDGDRYHPLEKLSDDMERQAILERLGWTFIRIRGSVYFRNPETTMASVVEKLSDLGIEPIGHDAPTVVSESDQRPGIVEQVIRRGAELRAQWANPDSQAELETERGYRNLDENTRVEERSVGDESDSVAGFLRQSPSEDAGEVAEPAVATATEGNEDSSTVVAVSLLHDASLSASSDNSTAIEQGIHGQVEVVEDEFRLASPSEVIGSGAILAGRILKLLEQRPGLKAREIARELRAERSDVNSLLYGRLGSKVIQDDEYRWRCR